MEDSPYVMPSFVKLLVTDAARSTRFYEALGFTRVHTDAVFVHLRWRRYADLFLVSLPPGRALPGPVGLGVLVCFSSEDTDVGELAGRALAQGAPVEGPTPQPWHTREVIISDPDGYRLNFVQPSGTQAP